MHLPPQESIEQLQFERVMLISGVWKRKEVAV